VPDDLAGIGYCFSPGVSNVSGFERDCAERQMTVFMADRSVDGPAEQHARFHFVKKYLGAVNNDDFMTCDQWVADSLPPGSTGDLLLQIDIEGAEYEVFLAMSDALLRRFRVIVAEFHNLHSAWNRPFFGILSRTFDKILQTHQCVHIHPNNCAPIYSTAGIEIPPVAEFTFLRRDRCTAQGRTVGFPHPLDADCAPGASIVLPKGWYTADPSAA
jgi:Methyltransferase FkbM domain